MKFEKWQALGNDYVIVEGAALPWELTPERVVRLCTPHFGIGADGILLLAPPPSGGPVAKLRVFNPDGSEAELSGNGARQAALYLRARGWTNADEFAIATAAGEVRPRIAGPETVSAAPRSPRPTTPGVLRMAPGRLRSTVVSGRSST